MNLKTASLWAYIHKTFLSEPIPNFEPRQFFIVDQLELKQFNQVPVYLNNSRQTFYPVNRKDNEQAIVDEPPINEPIIDDYLQQLGIVVQHQQLDNNQDYRLEDNQIVVPLINQFQTVADYNYTVAYAVAKFASITSDKECGVYLVRKNNDNTWMALCNETVAVNLCHQAGLDIAYQEHFDYLQSYLKKMPFIDEREKAPFVKERAQIKLQKKEDYLKFTAPYFDNDPTVSEMKINQHICCFFSYQQQEFDHYYKQLTDENIERLLQTSRFSKLIAVRVEERLKTAQLPDYQLRIVAKQLRASAKTLKAQFDSKFLEPQTEQIKAAIKAENIPRNKRSYIFKLRLNEASKNMLPLWEKYWAEKKQPIEEQIKENLFTQRVKSEIAREIKRYGVATIAPDVLDGSYLEKLYPNLIGKVELNPRTIECFEWLKQRYFDTQEKRANLIMSAGQYCKAEQANQLFPATFNVEYAYSRILSQAIREANVVNNLIFTQSHKLKLNIQGDKGKAIDLRYNNSFSIKTSDVTDDTRNKITPKRYR